MSIETTAWAWQQDTGSPQSKLVLIILSNGCDQEGEFHYDIETLRKYAEFDEVGSLKDVLADLDNANLIEDLRWFMGGQSVGGRLAFEAG